jgi:uncharacterized protein YjbI with pentapeptide repeats/lipoprotein-anchoring transpeptidase ErfK/SrfK/peptidoglycan hydrolase-like protein with peptidoglycan-binding domain
LCCGGGRAALSSTGHHANILRSGPAAWNAWRKKRPATIPHLSGIVLAASERELSQAGGAPINLKSAHLRDAIFRFATLSAADLQCADLARADLVHARLIRANLGEASLQGAALDHADLGGAVLRGASLRGASLRFATLEGADLEGAELSGADIAHARLAHANLAGADLRGAILDYADFAGADLSGADLSGARLYNARNLSRPQLEACRGDASTVLPAHLRGCLPWSAAGDDALIPTLDSGELWLRQARRDLRKRTVYGQTVQVAGVLVMSAAVVTSFVTETAREILPVGPTRAQKSVEPTLSTLAAPKPATAPKVVAPPVLAQIAPPKLSSVAPGPALALAPSPHTIEPATARIPQPAPARISEALPQVLGATPLDPAKEAEDVVALSTAVEGLKALHYGSVVDARVEPVTLAPAAAQPASLTMRQAAVLELRPRAPKLTALAPSRKLRLSQLKQARVLVPSLRAFDDSSSPPPAAVLPNIPEPLLIVVSLEAQKIDVYRGIEPIASAKISSGMRGYETRMGVFSILEKKRRHHSNLYSGAPMPFMQRLTRSGTALHAGALPGYPASHGCVRLPYSFAPKLFAMTSVGENVVVTKSRAVPKRIEHPNLFPPAANSQLAMAADGASLHRVSDAVDVAAAGASGSEDHGAAFRSDAPLRILVTRRTAHDRVIAIQYLLADLGYLPHQNFTGNIGAATRSAIRAFQKAGGLPETGAFTEELVKDVYRAAGKTEPPEGHLFVRQGFKRVFDLPVAFHDPNVSLGTHVFTVTQRDGAETGPEWMAVSLEGGDAARALDRIDIPDDVRRTIAPRLTPGSTLIIADKSEYSAILPEGDDYLISSGEQTNTADAKVEQASLAPATAEPVKPKRAKPRTARATPVAKPRTYSSFRREIRRRAVVRPSPFGLPYLFGR